MLCREWNRKHSLLLLLWWPCLGTDLPVGRQSWFWGNNNLYSAIWVFQCSLSVKHGQSLWSLRRGKQLRHKKGRLDTRISETSQSKRDVLKFYSMSAPSLQKCWITFAKQTGNTRNSKAFCVGVTFCLSPLLEQAQKSWSAGRVPSLKQWAMPLGTV